MKRGVTVLILLACIVLLTGFASAEKTWNFNNQNIESRGNNYKWEMSKKLDLSL